MKKRKSKTSRENYFDLPPELMSEVLARLPAKTLIKFRSVSKTWLSLIDSFDFISLHSNFHNNNAMNNPQLLAWENRLPIGSILTLRTSDTFETIRNLATIHKNHLFRGCCNGLMLINYHRNWLKLLLCNPSIGKALMLPDSPLNDVVGYQLGFAPSSNDYKVLALNYCKGAAIYSLTDNCWRIISDRLEVKSDQFDVKACALLLVSTRGVVCCGGAIYSMDYKANNLYSFDFDAEEFSVVQPPDSVKESMVRFVFCIGDSPAIFTMSSENSLIWVMKKDGGQNPWRLWYSGEPNSYICKLRKNSILGIVYLQNSNTFIIYYKCFDYPTCRKLMTYNITSQEIKHLENSFEDRMSFCIHVESLVFHKGFEGQRLISLPSEEEMSESS